MWEREERAKSKKRNRERRKDGERDSGRDGEKHPPSVGGTHKIGLLIHVAIIKDQKSALEVAWRLSSEKITNQNLYFW